ncbi:MAG: exopolysaccharide biosynthesis protein [Alphaproteobacteria bacterium]|nr:exopolysaccharide biosynthesis protein [Alphaproteobacteria bacterium]
MTSDAAKTDATTPAAQAQSAPVKGRKREKPLRTKRARREVRNLESLIDAINEEAGKSHLTLRELLEVTGHRTYGPLLLLIGLIAISPLTIVPGSTSIVAALTLLIAGQMAIGMKRPWLPGAALRLSFPSDNLRPFLEKVRPWARRIDVVLRPRLSFLASPPFVYLIALFVLAAAIITFPLSLIPFAPIVPGMAIVLFGLGITAKDGLLLTLGAAALAGAFYLAWPFLARMLG